MKIAACIKYSMDVSEIKVDPTTKALRIAGVPKQLGNINRNVLEMASLLKGKYGGTVHLISFGPPDTKNALKEALGTNADDAILVLEPEGVELDPAATACVLAAALRKLGGFDLVICGEASDDGFTYQVGPRLAERMGWPQLGAVRTLTVQDGCVTAERDGGDNIEVVKAPLPALVTVTEETNVPRKPTLSELVKGKKKSLVEWQLGKDLELKVQAVFDASATELIGSEGITIDRKRALLKDKPAADLAMELVTRLVQDRILESEEHG
jgi:electron transfer flavoprotein alpha/beta subunit